MSREKKLKNEKKGIYSITHVIVLLLLLIICSAGAGSYFFHVQQKDIILNQTAQNQLDSLQLAIADFDEHLDRLESFLYNYTYNNKDIMTLKYEQDEVSRFMAEQSLLSVLDQIISLSYPMDCVWIQYPDQENIQYLTRYSNTGILGADLAKITEYVQQVVLNTDDIVWKSDKWNLILCNQNYYLLWKIDMNGITCGAWIRLSQVFQQLQKSFSSDTEIHIYELLSDDLIYDNGNTLLPEQNARNNYFFDTPSTIGNTVEPFWYKTENGEVCAVSLFSKLNLRISALLPETSILPGTISPVSSYILPLALGLLVLFIIFFVSQFLLYRPFQKLATTIRTAHLYDTDAPLQINSALIEVNTLTNLINALMSETDRLKAEIYEAQVRERDIQCQYLQIRLKSHFYMNCLSIIHSLAQVNNTGLIQDMTVYLTNYLRFLHDDTDHFVSLDSELNHVRNYMHIQEVRFPDLFHYIEDVDISLLDCMIPPILLETFVENSVEHGMSLENDNWVKLTARFQMKEDLPGILFIIEDNGCGFDPEELEFLQQLSQGNRILQQSADNNNDSRHQETHTASNGIGIFNVISRLQILYSEKAEYHFQNKEEGGALIRIYIPMNHADYETEEM